MSDPHKCEDVSVWSVMTVLRRKSDKICAPLRPWKACDEGTVGGSSLFDALPARLRANRQFFGDSYSVKSGKLWRPQPLSELRKSMDGAGRRRRPAAYSDRQVEPECKSTAPRIRTATPGAAVTAPPSADLRGGRRKSGQTNARTQPMYDHEDWTRHRSTSRHLRHFLSTSSPRVVMALRVPVFIFTLLSAMVAAFNYSVVNRKILPAWIPVLRISAFPFQVAAPALGLLLLFRTNAAYGRFDEARKSWSYISSRTRDLARQALSWIQTPEDADNLNRLMQYIVAFPFCLKNQLEPKKILKEELSDLLAPNELAAVVASPHGANHVIQMISGIIQSCRLSGVQLALMDGNVTQFHDSLAACERIFRTPVPLYYIRLTSLLLVIWHLVIPLALWDQWGWNVVSATLLSGTTLFCIDEVGVLIEEPFSILPLDSLCTTMQRSVQCLAESQAYFEAIQAIKPDTEWPRRINNKAGHCLRKE